MKSFARIDPARQSLDWVKAFSTVSLQIMQLENLRKELSSEAVELRFELPLWFGWDAGSPCCDASIDNSTSQCCRLTSET